MLKKIMPVRSLWLLLLFGMVLVLGTGGISLKGAAPAAGPGSGAVAAYPVHGMVAEAGESAHGGGDDITHRMMILVLQLALIVIAARIGGEIFERFLKQPAVLGELAAGMLIGPYALGPYLDIFGSGPLFPIIEGTNIPVSPELYGIATIASIILLFMVGLETDFHKFMRFVGPGFAVGIGGVVGSFVTGDLIYALVMDEGFFTPAALFMGTVSTATSVGITARVLSEKKQMDSPEGTTIIAGAVIDDVLGILILAIVGGIAAAGAGSEQNVNWGSIGTIALKAFGFWLVATALGIALASRIGRVMLWFKTMGSTISLGFGLALLLAGIAETFGLAMIIGAYIMGLALSKEEISHLLEERLMPIYACLVPIFFAVMGMLVNFEAMGGALVFGVIYTIIAIVFKVLGSALPCLFVGFNPLGAIRIGIGMLPRGEVALIVAGVGMSYGFIGQDMFGVVILMTLVTTLMAPPMLVRLFNIERRGTKLEPSPDSKVPEKLLHFDSINWTNHDTLLLCIQRAFGDIGFTLKTLNLEEGIYQVYGTVDKEIVSFTLLDDRDRLRLKTPAKYADMAREALRRAKTYAEELVNSLQISEEDVAQ